MRVTVEPTYEMSKVMGIDNFELDDVATVADVIEKSRVKCGEKFEELTRVAAIAVNGVLVNHKRGMKTALDDGDIVSFVKASAGG